jgi:dTDP-4-amino-4,6-dideoxygalactose transaminase
VAGKIPLSRVYQSETIDRRISRSGARRELHPRAESKAFEKELAAYFGVANVVLSSSWTAAVHLLHLAQIMPGQLKPAMRSWFRR